MPEREFDVGVVGAGAAGLMAAIFAGREAKSRGRALRIAAFDGALKIGAKILISGGGRCNVTNREVLPQDFNGNRNQIAKVLRSLPVAETIRFFESIGVDLKTEPTGKLFPVSDRARNVLDALIDAADAAGAELLVGHRIASIEKVGEGFRLQTSSAAAVTVTAVVLSTGGRSLPKTGSDGGGYRFVQALGHTVTETFPALVPLVLPRDHWLTGLSGIATEVDLALTESGGRLLRRLSGSMLLAHFGLSGPAVLDMSRHWIAARSRDSGVQLTASFAPGKSLQAIDQAISSAGSESPRLSIGSLVQRWVPERLGFAIVSRGAGVDPARPLAQLRREERRGVARALTALPLPVVSDRGFDYAEVTAGGVPLSEIDLATMASRLCPGLFLCGEILDVDGRIGGFNFQWAWATGRLAGAHVVGSLLSRAEPVSSDGSFETI